MIALAVVFVGLGSSHMMVLGRAAKFSGIIKAKLRHALITASSDLPSQPSFLF